MYLHNFPHNIHWHIDHNFLQSMLLHIHHNFHPSIVVNIPSHNPHRSRRMVLGKLGNSRKIFMLINVSWYSKINSVHWKNLINLLLFTQPYCLSNWHPVPQQFIISSDLQMCLPSDLQIASASIYVALYGKHWP